MDPIRVIWFKVEHKLLRYSTRGDRISIVCLIRESELRPAPKLLEMLANALHQAKRSSISWLRLSKICDDLTSISIYLAHDLGPKSVMDFGEAISTVGKSLRPRTVIRRKYPGGSAVWMRA